MVGWFYTCLGQFVLIYGKFSIWLRQVMFVLCLCGDSNVMLPKIKVSMNVINVGIFFVHCWTIWVSCCNCTNLLTDMLHHHPSGDYQFVWSDSAILFLITVWLHYWTLFYISIIYKSARKIPGKISCDFLWHHLKGQVYKTNPHKPDDPNVNIKTQIVQIMGALLHMGSTNIIKWFWAYTGVGGHFTHL